MKTKKEAETRARQVLKLMKTTGWSVYTWENLGWHWCLENCDGHFTLSTLNEDGSGEPSYNCLLSAGDSPHTGNPQWSHHVHHLDPNEAVTYQIEQAWAYVVRTARWLDFVDKLLYPKKQKVRKHGRNS
jgi:hypothetical protein